MRIHCLASLVLLTTTLSATGQANAPLCPAGEIAPRGGTLPLNAPALLLEGYALNTHEGPGANELETDSAYEPNEFQLLHDGVPIDVEMHERPDGFFEARLLEHLEQEETYEVLTRTNGCEHSCFSFTAGPRAPLPTSAGTLEVVEVTRQGGGDDFPLEAYAKLRFSPSEELEPFLNVARISLEGARAEADDVAWIWIARSEFAVTSRCDGELPAPAAVHVVVDVPGVDRPLRSASVVLDLDCSRAPTRAYHPRTMSGDLGETKTCSADWPGPDDTDRFPLRDGIAAYTGCTVDGRSRTHGADLGALGLLGLSLGLGLARRRRQRP